jgi:hypothetical protein
MVRSRLWAIAAGVCAVVAASPTSAQEPFYKGKRLTLLVNFDAGSATDIDARIFARHFIKHVDGAPQLIIQNMPGGGGANGTMYLGEVAPKDGTMVGFLTATAWNFAMPHERARLNTQKYEDLLSREAQRQHLHDVIGRKVRRLRYLQQREAIYGSATEPKDRIEIEDLERDIARLQSNLNHLDHVYGQDQRGQDE